MNVVRLNCLTISLGLAALSGCGSAKSHVTVTPKGVSISAEEPKPAFVFIPNLFLDGRVEHQTHSVLVLSADAAVAADKQVTRVLNASTNIDIADPEVFKSSLSTRVPLGVKDVRNNFLYGENVVRLEMEGADGDLGYSERVVVLRDYTVGATTVNANVINGFSAGQVDTLTSPVQVGAGGVLTSSFVPMVYQ